MNYGHFDDAHCEYVITRPDTPYPWINYLGSEEFLLPDEQHLWRLLLLQVTRGFCA